MRNTKLFLVTKGRYLELNPTKKAGKVIVLVGRDAVKVEEIAVPRIALENPDETAVFYGKKIYGEMSSNLRFRILPESREGEKIRTFLFAIENNLISKIKKTFNTKELPVYGIFPLSVFLYLSLKWDNYILAIPLNGDCEVLVKKMGKAKGFYFVPSKNLSLINVLRNSNKDLSAYLLSHFKGASAFTLNGFSKVSLDWGRLLRNFIIQKIDNLNFLNKEEIPKAETKKILLKSMAFLAAFLFPIYFFAIKPVMELKREIKTLEFQVFKLRKKYVEIESFKKRIEENKKLIDSLENNIPKVPKLELLLELSKIVPKGTILSRISVKKNELYLSGFTPSALDLLEKIEKSPRFKNAKFTSSITKGKGKFEGLDRFVLRAEVVE